MKLISVNYHYFRDVSTGNGIYPVSRRDFLKQIDLISKNYEFISQSDVPNLKYKKNGKNKCLLTFDDGLKEQMDAFDILKSIGVPSTFYVSTDAIQYKKAIDVHKIHYIRSEVKDSELFYQAKKNLDIKEIKFDRNILDKQYRYDSNEAKELKYLLNFIISDNEKKKFIDSIFKNLISQESKFCEDTYMNENDIINLHKYGCLGTHGASHRALGILSENEAKDDIIRSVDFLEKIIGSKVPSLSYPYGGPTAVPDLPNDFFCRLGLEFALTMERGINKFPIESIYQLKRFDTNDVIGGKFYNKGYFND